MPIPEKSSILLISDLISINRPITNQDILKNVIFVVRFGMSRQRTLRLHVTCIVIKKQTKNAVSYA